MDLRIPARACTDTGLPNAYLIVRSIHNILWPTEEWPRGWTAKWEDLPDAWGYCDWETKCISLDPDTLSSESVEGSMALIPTIIHELQHLRCGADTPHSKSFTDLEKRLASRLGVAYKGQHD